MGGIIAAMVVLVKKIMAMEPRPGYDPPPTSVGETRFGRCERDEMSRRALLLPTKSKIELDQEVRFRKLDAGRRTAYTYKATYELMMRGFGRAIDRPGDQSG